MPSLHLFQYVSEVGPWLSADGGMVLVVKNRATTARLAYLESTNTALPGDDRFEGPVS
jgi:hypothetical protein